MLDPLLLPNRPLLWAATAAVAAAAAAAGVDGASGQAMSPWLNRSAEAPFHVPRRTSVLEARVPSCQRHSSAQAGSSRCRPRDVRRQHAMTPAPPVALGPPCVVPYLETNRTNKQPQTRSTTTREHEREAWTSTGSSLQVVVNVGGERTPRATGLRELQRGERPWRWLR